MSVCYGCCSWWRHTLLGSRRRHVTSPAWWRWRSPTSPSSSARAPREDSSTCVSVPLFIYLVFHGLSSAMVSGIARKTFIILFFLQYLLSSVYSTFIQHLYCKWSQKHYIIALKFSRKNYGLSYNSAFFFTVFFTVPTCFFFFSLHLESSYVYFCLIKFFFSYPMRSYSNRSTILIKG